MTGELKTLAKVWPSVQTALAVPRNEKEYGRLVRLLDELVDTVGNDEGHPLASLMETLGSLVESYESAHLPEPCGEPLHVLELLLEEHGLRQSDLPEVGSRQGVVSEILSGKRQMNLRQVRSLSRRFGVSPAVFI